ncbi:MAG: hypothetical protein LBD04_08290 [Synergistaceae bacterium]|jgi:hypothetical protein|nr:hypothetical protein [Synergistaceae bacterium]
MNDTESPAAPEQAKGKTPALCFSFFAAILTGVAVWTEASTSICAGAFFDPMPSWWHLIGLVWVPLILAVTALMLRMEGSLSPWLYLANGYLVAVSAGYTLLFGPVVLAGVILLTFYMGLGLLPHAPLISLIVAVTQSAQLRRRAAMPGKAGFWRWWLTGVVVALVVFLGVETRQWVAHQIMAKTRSQNPEVRTAALNRLRWWRLEDVVLEACYPSGGKKFLLFSTEFFLVSESRALYYLLTGKDYRDAPAPYKARRSERDILDIEVGGGAVGSTPPDLVLNSSTLDVSVAGRAGTVAYAELTLEFLNGGQEPREARCQIVMPPGGVASRLTLWIDGEEREAAFGQRSIVREAYRKVVVTYRRDPALLTTAGPDRVLLQCFPVNPGVPMKVKVGFTLPLVPAGKQMLFQPPYLTERNFTFVSDKPTMIWADGQTPLSPAPSGGALKRETQNSGRYTVSGATAPQDLALPLLLMPSPEPGTVYRARFSGVEATAELRKESAMSERFVAVVLDTSKQCEEMFGSLDWGAILREMPEGVKAALFAGPLIVPPIGRDEAVEKWPALLREVKYVGGDDQTVNLEKAWRLCASERNAVVLWIHGPLPVDIGDLSGLERRMRFASEEKNDVLPRLLSFQALPGPNRIEEKLSHHGLVRLIALYGLSVESSFKDVFSKLLYPTARDRELVFSLISSVAEEGAGDFGSSHVVRLALAGDVVRKLSEGARGLDDETETVLKLRLVTPLSGAVVLENQEQYAEHDLNPTAYARNVPTIPEPEEWAILTATLFLLFLAYQWRSLKTPR